MFRKSKQQIKESLAQRIFEIRKKDFFKVKLELVSMAEICQRNIINKANTREKSLIHKFLSLEWNRAAVKIIKTVGLRLRKAE